MRLRDGAEAHIKVAYLREWANGDAQRGNGVRRIGVPRALCGEAACGGWPYRAGGGARYRVRHVPETDGRGGSGGAARRQRHQRCRRGARGEGRGSGGQSGRHPGRSASRRLSARACRRRGAHRAGGGGGRGEAAGACLGHRRFGGRHQPIRPQQGGRRGRSARGVPASDHLAAFPGVRAGGPVLQPLRQGGLAAVGDAGAVGPMR